MKEAGFKYRCRMCGAVFGNSFCAPSHDRISHELQNAIHNITVNRQLPIPMIGMHICKQDQTMYGIADLIGAKIEDGG